MPRLSYKIENGVGVETEVSVSVLDQTPSGLNPMRTSISINYLNIFNFMVNSLLI